MSQNRNLLQLSDEGNPQFRALRGRGHNIGLSHRNWQQRPPPSKEGHPAHTIVAEVRRRTETRRFEQSAAPSCTDAADGKIWIQ